MKQTSKDFLVGFVASYCTIIVVGIAIDILHAMLGISASSFLYEYLTDPKYLLMCVPPSWLIGWIIRTRVLNRQPNSR